MVEVIVGCLVFVSFDIEKLEGSFICLLECDEFYLEIDEVFVVEYYN